MSEGVKERTKELVDFQEIFENKVLMTCHVKKVLLLAMIYRFSYEPHAFSFRISGFMGYWKKKKPVGTNHRKYIHGNSGSDCQHLCLCIIV